MRRWLILIACGLANISSAATESDPGAAAPAVPPILLPGPIQDDGSIRDSINAVPPKAAPDVKEELPFCLKRIVYLREHNDNIMALAYLRQVVTYRDLLPQDRAQIILQLADCLALQHQEAESLCWLKMWTVLYPTRPEIGAVAYRIAVLYLQMGLTDLARDAFYLALAHTINQGQVQNAEDLKNYTRLTVATLWGLADNEYQSNQWARAAELFARYRQECPTASAASLEKAAFLQADCYYQLKQIDPATSLYEETLQKHPFHPLAPEARLRLYHLYVLKHQPEQAREELESLAWTVRTVCPEQETYWQKQTAQLLLALNRNDASILPPLLRQSAQLPPEGKTWQETLNHYDALVSCQAVTKYAIMDSPVPSSSPQKTGVRPGLPEEDDLFAANRQMNQLLPPPPRPASTQ